MAAETVWVSEGGSRSPPRGDEERSDSQSILKIKTSGFLDEPDIRRERKEESGTTPRSQPRTIGEGQRWLNACLVRGAHGLRSSGLLSPRGAGDHQLFPAISPGPPASHPAASLGGEAGAINHRER